MPPPPRFSIFFAFFPSPLQRLAHSVCKSTPKSLILQNCENSNAWKKMELWQKNCKWDIYWGFSNNVASLSKYLEDSTQKTDSKRLLLQCSISDFTVKGQKSTTKGECKIRNCYDFQDINFLCCWRLELLKIVVINVRLKIEIWQMH